MEPMFDEPLRAGKCSFAGSQPSLERGQRTRHVEPRLDDDEADGCEVRCPEPPSIDPNPAAKIARDHDGKSADDEDDERKVQHTHRVREQPE